LARPDPKDRVHLVERLDGALALARSAQKDRAVPVLRHILSEDPTNYLAAHTLGDVLFDLGRDRDAISAYRVAMRGREVAYYHYRLALLHERLGDGASAADEFGAVVRLSGDAAKEVVDRAAALLDRGASEAALGYLDALSAARANGAALNVSNDDLHRTRADVLNAMGVGAGEAGDLARATTAFAEAVELAPDHFEALANLGFTRLRQGDAVGAVDALERALALRPREVRVLNAVAELRYRGNELERARELLTRSLASDPHQPRIERALRDVERRLAR
jgi:protein O-GlcNAc transferase